MSDSYRVLARHERFRGPIFQVLTDEVQMPGGGHADRDYVIHVGAVAVAAVAVAFAGWAGYQIGTGLNELIGDRISNAIPESVYDWSYRTFFK